MNSGTFWDFQHAFWNILHAFWNILEHSACILEHSACILKLLSGIFLTKIQFQQKFSEIQTIDLKVFLVSLPVSSVEVNIIKAHSGSYNQTMIKKQRHSYRNLATLSQNRPFIMIRPQLVHQLHHPSLDNLPFPRGAQSQTSPGSGQHPGKVLDTILDPKGEMTIDVYYNRHDLMQKMVIHNERPTVNQRKFTQLTDKPLTIEQDKAQTLHSDNRSQKEDDDDLVAG